jgi:putative toxin-antitoxin system antitoxin component (TIGR02293 family)
VANGTSHETGKLLRLARVIGRADEVFDDLDAAVDWLKSPNAALRGNAPLSLLDTDIDAEAMLDTLGRIEPGVFA